MLLERRNFINGEVTSMELDITKEQLNRWMDGELIQNVFPNLSAGEREFIRSGFSLEYQKELFGE